MPGNGTFNLTALWRALGIKNPEPSMRESVQPVINVGDFHALVPRHIPPTQAFGGDIANIALEFPIIQVVSRGIGGCVILSIGQVVIVQYRTDIAFDATLTQSVAAATFSNEPVASEVFFGNVVASPGDQLVSPSILSPQFVSWPPNPEFVVWLAPGTVFTMFAGASGSMTDWSVILQDVPASEPPEQ